MSLDSVGHRYGLDLALLWLWCRPAAAALICPLAWELPYAVGVALKCTHAHTHTHTHKMNWCLVLTSSSLFSSLCSVHSVPEFLLTLGRPLKAEERWFSGGLELAVGWNPASDPSQLCNFGKAIKHLNLTLLICKMIVIIITLNY